MGSQVEGGTHRADASDKLVDIELVDERLIYFFFSLPPIFLSFFSSLTLILGTIQ